MFHYAPSDTSQISRAGNEERRVELNFEDIHLSAALVEQLREFLLLEFQSLAGIRSRVPVSLLNQAADFGINNIQRPSRIDPHEVLHLVLKMKKGLTAQLQLRQGLFTLACKKHVRRCI